MSHLNSLKVFVPAGILALSLLVLFCAQELPAQEGLGDMVFDSKIESMEKAGVKPVVFPHTKHEAIAACNDCHPKVFVDKRGANDMSMRANMKGEFCGTANCHNTGAFPLFECAKCHTYTGG